MSRKPSQSGRLLLAIAIGFLGLVSSAHAEDPGALGPGRFLASPMGKVAWMDVEEQRLFVSDLETGVAALDPDKGRILWTYAATRGRITGVWALGEHVAVAAGAFQVLDAATGALLWQRDLQCGAPERCVESAHFVGPDGVLMTGTGVRHTSMRLVDLYTSKPVWPRQPAVVHPQQVLIDGTTIVSVDGPPNHGIRVIDRLTGRAAPVSIHGRIGPPSFLGLNGEGDVWATYRGDRRRLANVLVQAADGKVRVRKGVPRPADTAGAPRWAHMEAEQLWLWGSDSSTGERWLVSYGVSGQSPPRVMGGAVVDRPLIIGDILLVHRHDGRALELIGFHSGTGKAVWSHRLDAPQRRGAWHEISGLGLLALQGQPGPLLLVDPRNGALVAVGEVDAPGEQVVGAKRVGRTLYVGVQEGVFAHPIVPLGQLTDKISLALKERRTRDAQSLFHPLALAADMSDQVLNTADRMIRDAVLEARLDPQSPLDRTLEIFVWGLSSLDRGGGRSLGLWSAQIAATLGDLLLADRVAAASPEQTLLLERLALQLAGAVERAGDALSEGRGASQGWESLRDGMLLLASSLARANRGAEASALLDKTAAWAPESIPGLEPLRHAVAVGAVEQALRELEDALDSSMEEHRAEALEALTEGDLLARALPGKEDLIDLLQVASERRYSRQDVRRLKGRLERELRRSRDLVGLGLGEPGCLLACDALERTCSTGCRDENRCGKAGKACRRACRRSGLSWRPGRALPRKRAAARACF